MMHFKCIPSQSSFEEEESNVLVYVLTMEYNQMVPDENNIFISPGRLIRLLWFHFNTKQAEKTTAPTCDYSQQIRFKIFR